MYMGSSFIVSKFGSFVTLFTDLEKRECHRSSRWSGPHVDIWIHFLMARISSNCCISGRNGFNVSDWNLHTNFRKQQLTINPRAPTSGGQYHWTAILSPAKSSTFISWFVGWIATIGWIANTAAGAFFGATMIQGLLVLNYPDYILERWHGTLLMWAILLVVVFVNTIAAKLLPKIEGAILAIHVVGFFAILIPLVKLAPHGSPSVVFTQFVNSGGYSSNGLAFFIGLISTNLPFIGM